MKNIRYGSGTDSLNSNRNWLDVANTSEVKNAVPAFVYRLVKKKVTNTVKQPIIAEKNRAANSFTPKTLYAAIIK